MRLVFNQTKNGFFSSLAFFMNFIANGATSEPSKSCMRSACMGPVSSMVCLPTRPKRASTVASSLSDAKEWITPRVELLLVLLQAAGVLLGEVLVVPLVCLLHDVQVVEQPEEFVEAVRRR